MSGPVAGGEEAAALGIASRQHARRQGAPEPGLTGAIEGKRTGSLHVASEVDLGPWVDAGSGLSPTEPWALRPVTSVSPGVLWHEF